MNELRPLLSVIIPVFNSGKTALLAIESVLNQGLESFEIVIVDDGSLDQSVQILSSFIASHRDSSITLIKQENVGASGARNRGIAAARGSFIAFLDSDDLWLSEKSSIQLKIFAEDPKIGMVGSLTNSAGSMFNFLKREKKVYVIKYFDQLLSNRFQTSTVMIRSDVLNVVGGFPSNQRYAEEGDLFLRIVFRYKTVISGSKLVNYSGGKLSFGESGLSSNLLEMWKGELANLNRAYQRGEVSWLSLRILRIYSRIKFLRRLIYVWTSRRKWFSTV